MALPFVPHEHILRLFRRISSEAPDGKLKDICTYGRFSPMSMTHGSAATYGHLFLGLYSNRTSAQIMMWKAGTTRLTGKPDVDRSNSIFWLNYYMKSQNMWRLKPNLLGKSS